MNIFEKLKSEHITINFIDEDGNNTLLLMKNKQSVYIYTDYNNVDFMIPVDIEIDGDKIKFKTILSGDRKVRMKIEYKTDTKLHIYKETNDIIVADGDVRKDETTSKKNKMIAFIGDFVE